MVRFVYDGDSLICRGNGRERRVGCSIEKRDVSWLGMSMVRLYVERGLGKKYYSGEAQRKTVCPDGKFG